MWECKVGVLYQLEFEPQHNQKLKYGSLTTEIEIKDPSPGM
jgi:hypothetical protein